MTIEEIIDGLKFTMEMCLYNSTDGSMRPVSTLNDMDKTTYDACEGAIELLKQQPCEDCISRDEVIEDVIKCTDMNEDTMEVLEDKVRDLPSVTPQPKRGKWIFNENMHDYCCSECGCLMPNVNEYYRKKIIGCPYCLADMREVQDEQW